jgi:SAM-dependent methyltransferase
MYFVMQSFRDVWSLHDPATMRSEGSMGTCVSCGGALRPVRKYRFKSAAFRRVYSDRSVYACTACRLAQVDVSRVDNDALSRYYRLEYRAVAQIGVGDPGHRWYRARAAALAKLAVAHSLRAPKRVFEVGAGYGYNLLAIKELYPDAFLFTDELDETIALPKPIDRATLASGGYDIVILSHVLEHFSNPKSLIASALNALTVGGILLIEVPNDVPGIYALNGPDEPHLTFFTANSLELLLGTATIFGAGPPYQRKNIYMWSRRAALRMLHRMPIVSGFIARRSARIISPDSFSARRTDGIFLRAVLSNTSE